MSKKAGQLALLFYSIFILDRILSIFVEACQPNDPYVLYSGQSVVLIPVDSGKAPPRPVTEAHDARLLEAKQSFGDSWGKRAGKDHSLTVFFL